MNKELVADLRGVPAVAQVRVEGLPQRTAAVGGQGSQQPLAHCHQPRAGQSLHNAGEIGRWRLVHAGLSQVTAGKLKRERQFTEARGFRDDNG